MGPPPGRGRARTVVHRRPCRPVCPPWLPLPGRLPQRRARATRSVMRRDSTDLSLGRWGPGPRSEHPPPTLSALAPRSTHPVSSHHPRSRLISPTRATGRVLHQDLRPRSNRLLHPGLISRSITRSPPLLPSRSTKATAVARLTACPTLGPRNLAVTLRITPVSRTSPLKAVLPRSPRMEGQGREASATSTGPRSTSATFLSIRRCWRASPAWAPLNLPTTSLLKLRSALARNLRRLVCLSPSYHGPTPPTGLSLPLDRDPPGPSTARRPRHHFSLANCSNSRSRHRPSARPTRRPREVEATARSAPPSTTATTKGTATTPPPVASQARLPQCRRAMLYVWALFHQPSHSPDLTPLGVP